MDLFKLFRKKKKSELDYFSMAFNTLKPPTEKLINDSLRRMWDSKNVNGVIPTSIACYEFIEEWHKMCGTFVSHDEYRNWLETLEGEYSRRDKDNIIQGRFNP